MSANQELGLIETSDLLEEIRKRADLFVFTFVREVSDGKTLNIHAMSGDPQKVVSATAVLHHESLLNLYRKTDHLGRGGIDEIEGML